MLKKKKKSRIQNKRQSTIPTVLASCKENPTFLENAPNKYNKKCEIPSSSSSVQCCLAQVASFSLSWDVEDVSVSSPMPKETSLEAVWLGASLASPSLSNLSLFTSCSSASAGSSSECLFFTGLLWAPSDSDAGDSLQTTKAAVVCLVFFFFFLLLLLKKHSVACYTSFLKQLFQIKHFTRKR